jgi:hypothetical protein
MTRVVIWYQCSLTLKVFVKHGSRDYMSRNGSGKGKASKPHAYAYLVVLLQYPACGVQSYMCSIDDRVPI